ncbi:hypothetical protein FOL47_006663 [Perkinsus chesapeaki]|uniref:Uncharacterized protein n=1 Tax=Perkinsus chesapeaki TaxID=330153 RepID=A0A7J6LQI1_PERCH|nr:hypothetical protein FOL47_006663 [Perkinsus chesapeaki]
MCALGTIPNVQQKKIICSGGVSQAVDGDPTDPPSLAKFGGELNGPLRCAESVDLHREPLDEVIISDSFWYHLPSAPSYRIRVRRLRDDEFKDTEEQLFVFELDLKGAIKPTPNSPQSPNYSERLLSRLSEDDRALFYREVDGYLSRGWWLPKDQAERDDELNIPAITVFPVKSAKVGASTPIRPCCDARRFNAAAEPAGYLGADIASLTSRLLGAYSVGDSVFMLALASFGVIEFLRRILFLQYPP